MKRSAITLIPCLALLLTACSDDEKTTKTYVSDPDPDAGGKSQPGDQDSGGGAMMADAGNGDPATDAGGGDPIADAGDGGPATDAGDGDPMTDAGDGGPATDAGNATAFRVTIENLATALPYRQGGVFNKPVGEVDPAGIGPGQAYEVSFHAVDGDRLSFATMFVQSNDLFVAPPAEGIELFTAGTAVVGDITAQLKLWDAGSEINEEPGVGLSQAPRQGAANTGAADPDATVRLATDDFNNLPDLTTLIQATLSADASGLFTLRIENVGTATSLTTSEPSMLPVPFAPGHWVLHQDGMPLFTPGSAPSAGLEALAEDGNPAVLAAELAPMIGVDGPLAPGVFAVGSGKPLFTAGMPDAMKGLEALAEDGNPASLAVALTTDPNVVSSGVFNTPVGDQDPGAALPGKSYAFEFEASPGDSLSFATMFVQSNDLFFGPADEGLALFDGNGAALSGDITDLVMLWDAGSEVNEAPGVGSTQAPRQGTPNTGAAENGNVSLVNDGFDYVATDELIRVSIEVVTD